MLTHPLSLYAPCWRGGRERWRCRRPPACRSRWWPLPCTYLPYLFTVKKCWLILYLCVPYVPCWRGGRGRWRCRWPPACRSRWWPPPCTAKVPGGAVQDTACSSNQNALNNFVNDIKYGTVNTVPGTGTGTHLHISIIRISWHNTGTLEKLVLALNRFQ